MAGDEILFDPTAFQWPGKPPVQLCRREHVALGLSFQTMTKPRKDVK